MSGREMVIGIKITSDTGGITEVNNAVGALVSSLNEESKKLASELTVGVTAGKESIRQYQAELVSLTKSLNTVWTKEWSTAFGSVETALSKSISLGFKGGLDQAGPVWEKAWQALIEVPQNLLANLIGKLGGSLLDSLTNSITSSVLKPLADQLGLSSFFGDALKTLTSAASSVGGSIASWLGLAPAGAGAAGDAHPSRRQPASCLICTA